MNKKELTLILTLIVVSTSALFGAMTYVESRFVDTDELTSYSSQVINHLQTIETRLQSIEEALREK